MNSLWIQKRLECDEYTIQLTCPFCHDDKLFTHKDSEKMPKYCPMCGARMDLTDASDAELVDMLQDVLESRDSTIEDLRDQLDEKEEELFSLNNRYAELRHEYNLLNEVCNNMKKVLVKIRPNEWAALAKKYKLED
jgi:peptide subunit release factor 1 (eRF1)